MEWKKDKEERVEEKKERKRGRGYTQTPSACPPRKIVNRPNWSRLPEKAPELYEIRRQLSIIRSENGKTQLQQFKM